jgi:hypothetical protein
MRAHHRRAHLFGELDEIDAVVADMVEMAVGGGNDVDLLRLPILLGVVGGRGPPVDSDPNVTW